MLSRAVLLLHRHRLPGALSALVPVHAPASLAIASFRPVCTSSVAANKPMLVLPGDNRVRRLYKRLFKSVPASKLRACAAFLLSQCTDATDLEEFLERFDLPDTYYSWFLVTELHVWMLSVRLMAEETMEGRFVRNAMVDLFWKDCDMRAKKLGMMAMKKRGQQMVALNEEFQTALLIYDDGLLGDDKDLANAVWRRFFLCREPADLQQVEILVCYIRRTMSVLDHVDLNTLVMTEQLKWLPVQEEASAKEC